MKEKLEKKTVILRSPNPVNPANPKKDKNEVTPEDEGEKKPDK